MLRSKRAGAYKRNDPGQTLYLVAGGLVMLLGVSALAIDLVSFYVARSEAQRGADAAALAGAQVLVSCTSASGGCVAGGAQEAAATTKAVDTAAQNPVGGQAPTSSTVSTSFSYPTPQEPQITVMVYRDSGHSNPMPTFFGKIFGISTVDVSVRATAEAFNPSGSGNPIGATCLKPWIMPNCDTGHTSPNTNPNCPAGVAPFIDPINGAISNPGAYPVGVIGETLTIKPGTPGCAPAPSQYYPVDLPPAPALPSLCPTGPVCNTGGWGGGSLYRQNIACCNENQFVCGPVPITFEHGNLQGPTQQGVQCLISEDNNGTGQDILVPSPPSFSVTGGSNNSNPSLRGVTGLTTSSSIVTLPLYNGSDLCPGGSCGVSVTIVGFLQVFVDSVDLKDVGTGCNQCPQPPTCTAAAGNVHVTVLNIGGCGSSGSTGGSSGTPLGSGGSTIPIRLIQGPG